MVYFILIALATISSIGWIITAKINWTNKFWKNYYFKDLQETEGKLSKIAGESNKIIDKYKKGVELADTASWLVGHPATNVSSSTDLACEKWQED